jgi:hypothetical protein
MNDNKKNKNHKKEPIRVIFHCGYKGKELPRKLIFEGGEYLIEHVLSSQRVQISGTGKIIEKFLCLIEGKEVWISVDESGKVDVKFT